MYKLIATLLTASALMWGQAKGTEPPPAKPGDTIKVIEIKNAIPFNVARELNAVLGGLAAVTATTNGLIVRGSPETVSVIEAAAAKLDVPATPAITAANSPKNVELTIHLLYGSGTAKPDDKVPAELDSAVRQLRSVFPYQSYRVLDTVLLRARPNTNTEWNGILPGLETMYQLRVQPSIQGESPRLIHLQNLRFSARLRIVSGAFLAGDGTKNEQYQYMEVGFNADMDAREGQKTVLGKSNIGGTNDAIILVVTPKVID